MLRLCVCLWQVVFALSIALPLHAAHAQPAAPVSARVAEMRTSAAFERARREGPPALRAFLFAMPKGADLHSHLSGAVYAESWIRAAAEDGLCVDAAALAFVQPQEGGGRTCTAGLVPATALPGNQHLYDELVDVFSMRSFVPTTGNSGHDHFFATFDHFHGTGHAHLPEWLDEVSSRAAAQNEQYLELMHTPDFAAAAQLAHEAGYREDFAEYRRLMLERGLAAAIPAIRAQMDAMEAQQRQREHCGTAGAAPACRVTIRYLFQVLRNNPPESVFAQILLGFEVASADPRFVGINLVPPEDAYYAMHDYALHMQMIAALRPFYPKVKVSLHAGELAAGMAPPDGLAFHIRAAVETAHADRIGHGVDIMAERDPYALLRVMAAHGVLTEINLTSNDVILNVKDADYPLPFYLRYGVPVALSTDDEGVSRIDLTHEFERAADTYDLAYPVLKQMARNSLEYSFLPGESLWMAHDYRRPAVACRAELATEKTTAACAKLLNGSARAQQQRELELRFASFERQQAAQPAGPRGFRHTGSRWYTEPSYTLQIRSGAPCPQPSNRKQQLSPTPMPVLTSPAAIARRTASRRSHSRLSTRRCWAG